jgi:transcriptional regulator with XRE-family HTH domain
MTERIELLLKSMNLSPSRFADEINVQRSSVSHILSGRNKPSLDFITKVLSSYPQVNPDWLLFNNGGMLRKSDNRPEEEIQDQGKREETETTPTAPPSVTEKEATALIENFREENRVPYGIQSIEKIILLYSDGTFRTYNRSEKTSIEK